MKPRISIVTPYLDAAAFLQDAIDSVRAQTVSDWELLLIDDGSSDEGPAIARAAASQDNRIRVLASSADDAKGTAAARNRGLQEAKGDFIAFLDADDLFMPEKFETELVLLHRYGEAAMVCGAALWWYPQDQRRNWIDKNRSMQGLFEAPQLLNRLILLTRDEIPCICSVLIRRGAIETVGGFEESLRLYEDQSLWVKIMARYPVLIGNHLTSVYRQHGDSTSARAEREGEYDRMRIHRARIPFLEWVENYLLLSASGARSTERALRLAMAIARQDRHGLSLFERFSVATLEGHDLVKKTMARIRFSARRLLREADPLDVADIVCRSKAH
ncbi:MAG TPA: glycosyltransferase [Allosphingosinicella sp.]|nr:glycosyltransferase [Allosphingosinicella sp.]